MSTYVIILILIVLIFLYVKKRNKLKEAYEKQQLLKKLEKQLFIKKREEKERKLRKLKDEEDLELNVEESVLCEDGVERIYRNSMYGKIYNFTEGFFPKTDNPKSYDLGNSEIKGIAAYGKLKFTQKLKLGSIIRQKWFSQKGKFLNSSEILKLRRLSDRKEKDYYQRYRDLLPRYNISYGPSANIYIINELYFIKYCDRTPSFQLFNGRLDSLQYKNGVKKGKDK